MCLRKDWRSHCICAFFRAKWWLRVIILFFFLLKYSFMSSAEKNVLTQMVLIFFLKTWYDEQCCSLVNNASQGSSWSYRSFLSQTHTLFLLLQNLVQHFIVKIPSDFTHCSSAFLPERENILSGTITFFSIDFCNSLCAADLCLSQFQAMQQKWLRRAACLCLPWAASSSTAVAL